MSSGLQGGFYFGQICSQWAQGVQGLYSQWGGILPGACDGWHPLPLTLFIFSFALSSFFLDKDLLRLASNLWSSCLAFLRSVPNPTCRRAPQSLKPPDVLFLFLCQEGSVTPSRGPAGPSGSPGCSKEGLWAVWLLPSRSVGEDGPGAPALCLP
jgi:hypothetical protein